MDLKLTFLKSDIQDLLDSGEVIPETLPSQMHLLKKTLLYTKCD